MVSLRRPGRTRREDQRLCRLPLLCAGRACEALEGDGAAPCGVRRGENPQAVMRRRRDDARKALVPQTTVIAERPKSRAETAERGAERCHIKLNLRGSFQRPVRTSKIPRITKGGVCLAVPSEASCGCPRPSRLRPAGCAPASSSRLRVEGVPMDCLSVASSHCKAPAAPYLLETGNPTYWRRRRPGNGG